MKTGVPFQGCAGRMFTGAMIEGKSMFCTRHRLLKGGRNISKNIMC